MPKAKKTQPLRRKVTITVTCEDDLAERADVKMLMNIDPPIKQGELSMVMTTVLSMMRGAKDGADDWTVKAVKG